MDGGPVVAKHLRQRRAAASCCEPFEGGHRDPLDCIGAERRRLAPSAAERGRPPAGSQLEANPYGLSLREVRAEIRRCMARGFQLWEIRLRFAPDRKDDNT